MGGMIDPETGNVRCFPAGVPTLTPPQRLLAELRDGEADGILAALDDGQTWFTAYGLKTKPHGLDELAGVGILIKQKSTKHDGHYYKPTSITRAWCLTSLALRDERRKALSERSG